MTDGSNFEYGGDGGCGPSDPTRRPLRVDAGTPPE